MDAAPGPALSCSENPDPRSHSLTRKADPMDETGASQTTGSLAFVAWGVFTPLEAQAGIGPLRERPLCAAFPSQRQATPMASRKRLG
jgi:hypothetical protein